MVRNNNKHNKILGSAVLLTCALTAQSNVGGNVEFLHGIESQVTAVDPAGFHQWQEKRSNKQVRVNEIPEEEAAFYDCKEEDDQGHLSAEEQDEVPQVEELSGTKSRFAQVPPRRKRLNLAAPRTLRAQTKTARGPGWCAPFSRPRKPANRSSSTCSSTGSPSVPLMEPRKVPKRVMWRDHTGDDILEDVQFIENCLAPKPILQRVREFPAVLRANVEAMNWKSAMDPKTDEGGFVVGLLLWYAVIAAVVNLESQL